MSNKPFDLEDAINEEADAIVRADFDAFMSAVIRARNEHLSGGPHIKLEDLLPAAAQVAVLTTEGTNPAKRIGYVTPSDVADKQNRVLTPRVAWREQTIFQNRVQALADKIKKDTLEHLRNRYWKSGDDE